MPKKKEKTFKLELTGKQLRILANSYRRYHVQFDFMIPAEDNKVLVEQIEVPLAELSPEEYADTEIKP